MAHRSPRRSRAATRPSRREWRRGDIVELGLPVERRRAHPEVLQAQGKVALKRGPLVYSFEQADNAVPLRDVTLPRDAVLANQFASDLAGGVVTVTAEGVVVPTADWEGRLYQPVETSRPKAVRLTAVPYAIWGNRGAGEMIVWMDSSF